MITQMTDAPSEEAIAKPKQSGTDDTAANVPESRAALVKQWLAKIADSRDYWGDSFKQMDECQTIATKGGDKTWTDDKDKYVVPIVTRHINLAVSQLYARDPRAVAKRRRRLSFKLWDGNPETYQAALMAVQPPPTVTPTPMGPIDAATMQPWQPDPNAVALVEEVAKAQAEIKMLEKLGKTLEILWSYYTGEQANGFKQQMKALVRRTKVNGISYVKLLFQRELKRHPETGAQIDDATQQLAVIEQGMKALQAGDIDEQSAKAEELRLLLKKLQADEYVIAREGPVFDFPKSKRIIVDKKVEHIKTLVGADWTAHEFEMTPEEVEQTYGVKIAGQFTEHKPGGDKVSKDGEKPKSVARVYEVEHKKNCETFAVCVGYPDFLREPGNPDVKIERFWTLFPLVFNEVENDECKIPPSDVWLLRHTQAEFNRSREALREHRIASKPKYATPKGSLDKTDRDALELGEAHKVVELKGLKPGQPINQLIQSIQPATIDPNIYSTAEHFADMQRVVGTQEANLGGTSDGTATEASIAEQSRTASLSDNTDDLDDLLTELARAFAQLCLTELSAETVREIAGPGAVWPDMPQSREEIAKDLYLTIKAGSSGRPNQAADLAKMERGLPYLVQIPGLNPKVIAEKYATLLDLDPEELLLEGLPSIQAINAAMSKQAAQPSTGDPATDPGAQGQQGGQNAQKPPQIEAGGLPAYPSSDRPPAAA
jgi:hypothetical protein